MLLIYIAPKKDKQSLFASNDQLRPIIDVFLTALDKFPVFHEINPLPKAIGYGKDRILIQLSIDVAYADVGALGRFTHAIDNTFKVLGLDDILASDMRVDFAGKTTKCPVVNFNMANDNIPNSEMIARMRKSISSTLKTLDVSPAPVVDRKTKLNEIMKACKLDKVSKKNLEIALRSSAAGDYYEALDLLVDEKDIDIDAKDGNEKIGKTALHWAVFKGHKNCAMRLLGKGAKATIGDAKGETALDYLNASNDNGMKEVFKHFNLITDFNESFDSAVKIILK